MSPSIGRLIAAGAVLTSLVVVSPAAACGGDGPAGPVVDRGLSPGGQAWTQKACQNGPELLVDLSLPQPDGEDFGGGLGAPAPSNRSPMRVGARADRVGPGAEGELDGVAFRTVTRVKIEFAAGAPVVVPTRPAPSPARRRHAYLRSLRFFVVFFPGSRRPTSVSGLSVAGRALARSPVG